MKIANEWNISTRRAIFMAILWMNTLSCFLAGGKFCGGFSVKAIGISTLAFGHPTDGGSE